MLAQLGACWFTASSARIREGMAVFFDTAPLTRKRGSGHPCQKQASPSCCCGCCGCCGLLFEGAQPFTCSLVESGLGAMPNIRPLGHPALICPVLKGWLLPPPYVPQSGSPPKLPTAESNSVQHSGALLDLPGFVWVCEGPHARSSSHYGSQPSRGQRPELSLHHHCEQQQR